MYKTKKVPLNYVLTRHRALQTTREKPYSRPLAKKVSKKVVAKKTKDGVIKVDGIVVTKDEIKSAQEYAESGIYFVNDPKWGKDYPIIRAKWAPRNKRTDKVEDFHEDDKINEKIYEKGWNITTIENGRVVTFWVENDRYKRPNFKDGYHDQITADKFVRNNEFCDFLLEYQRPDRHVAYLDSVCGLSTFMLLGRVKLEKYQLNVPNPNSSIHTGKTLSENVLSFANVYNSTFYEFLRDDESGSQYDIGYDACGEFEGNSMCRPKRDMDLIFSRGIFPYHNGIMWLTFSVRRFSNREQYIDEVFTYIHNKAREYGYDIEMLKSGLYGKGRSIMYIFLRSK